ncbi:hypothetical protein AB0539_004527 [Vibrio parahaemolyticus]
MIKEIVKNGVSYCNYSIDELIKLGFTHKEIEASKQAQNIEAVHVQRRAAYINESDPLFLEWQYDQTPEKEQAWRDKVAEIKARYPLPSES